MLSARTIAVLSITALAILIPGPGAAQPVDGVPLPVRKVLLYKNGMGYFEHLGDVRGAQAVEIALSSAQLNDVLKSLTAIDLAPAPIVSVTYESSKPADRQLADLPVKLGTFSGVTSFLNEIRGADVEIDTPAGPVAGRVMSAEVRKKDVGGGATADVLEVTLFGAGGQLRTLDLTSAKGLRLRGRELSTGVQRYLEILETARRQDVRRLRIQTRAEGARKLFVGYTSEAPIWKTTYRLVLDEKKPKPFLQGWAIVDNTTAMDWIDVELALVAGAPISFVHRLSEPLYARRPEVPLAEGVQAAPQVHAPAPTMAAAPPVARSAPKEFSIADAAPPVAEGKAVGEQFEYRMPQAVTLRRNESAMFPIVNADVEGEKVAIWSPRTRDLRPRTGLLLTNTSGRTLAPGAFTVIDTGTFAGEGLTETIHPGERRLLSYGLDLAMTVATLPSRGQERVERVVVRDGVIRWHVRSQAEVVYRATSQHATPRTVVIEHPVEPHYALVAGHAPPMESTASFHRFRITVPARSSRELVVRTEKPEQTTVAIDSRLGRDRIALWVRERRIDAATERSLAPVIDGFEEIQGLATRAARIDDEVKTLFLDQTRVRENLAKLGQGPEESTLRLRYVRRLEEQEQRLDALRADKTRLDAARIDAERRVDQLLKSLVIDRAL
jgi:hypothetical protein